MSVFDSRKNTIFIIVVTLISIIAFIAGYYAIQTINQKDKISLLQVYTDYKQLEDDYSQEIDNINSGVLFYVNADSVKENLNTILMDIRKRKNNIKNKPTSESIAKIENYYTIANQYKRFIARHSQDKDDYTSREIVRLNTQIKAYKAQINTIHSQNKTLSGRLSTIIKRFKGTEKELNRLKAQKVRLDTLLAQQEEVLQKLENVTTDRHRLKDLLAQSEEIVRSQQEEIQRLKGVTSKAYNFLAAYQYKRRAVPLDETGRHKRANVNKQIDIAFDVGESIFSTDDSVRMVYLTLYKAGKPFEIVKAPVKVSPNNQANYSAVFNKRLPKGDYYFELTYQEEPIMADYKFKIQ